MVNSKSNGLNHDKLRNYATTLSVGAAQLTLHAIKRFNIRAPHRRPPGFS
jgi:hypothetical protein